MYFIAILSIRSRSTFRAIVLSRTRFPKFAMQLITHFNQPLFNRKTINESSAINLLTYLRAGPALSEPNPSVLHVAGCRLSATSETEG